MRLEINLKTARRRVHNFNYLCAVLFCSALSSCAKTSKLEVNTTSMTPALSKGDLVTGQKPQQLSEIDRLDVIVYKQSSQDPNRQFLSRVIGLPGETLLFENESVSLKETGEIVARLEVFDKRKIVTIPADSFYLLNDNLRHDIDSRLFGTISFSEILWVIISNPSK